MPPTLFDPSTWLEAIREALVGETWPPKRMRALWERMELWDALRRSDVTRLKQEAGIPWQRRLLISPVPRMVSRAKAHLLYGEPAAHVVNNDQDQARLDYIISQNGLPAEQHRGAQIASSLGSVWGKVAVDPSILDVPIIEHVSPLNVIPHFRGRFVFAATFVYEWPESSTVIIRLLETYEPGGVRSQLFRGTNLRLGSPMDLSEYPATRGREEFVATGFDRPLCAFIANSLDADPTVGYSDYQGLEERFLAINEAATIGQENLRLAGKKRALLDAKYLRNGRLPPGDDLFIRQEDNPTAGEAAKPLQMLEYTFESDATIAWCDTLIDTSLQFAGASPELMGRRLDGGAISGTALKLRMIHSLMEAGGTGGYFDRGEAFLLRAAAVIDSRPTTQGGFGRRWSSPDEDPQIERGDGLPRDDMEAAQWLVLAAGADAISLEERVRWLHPDWSQADRDEEVERIREQSSTPAAAATVPGIATPRPPLVPQLPAGEPAGGEEA